MAKYFTVGVLSIFALTMLPVAYHYAYQFDNDSASVPDQEEQFELETQQMDQSDPNAGNIELEQNNPDIQQELQNDASLLNN